MNKCEFCGKENDENYLICSWCGHSIKKAETISENDTPEDKAFKAYSSLKAFGCIMLILGIVLDIVSIPLIFSASAEGFAVITVIGLICFFVGLIFTFI